MFVILYEMNKNVFLFNGDYKWVYVQDYIS